MCGLRENLNFDMSVKTYIRKVTVTNKAGTESTEYKEDNGLVKTEIKAKYLDGSKVEVEYIIKVTNVGDLAGYVNQIENVIPNGFEVSRASNWTVGDDGNLYSSSLNKIKIEPNESKQLSLILTKTMNSKNTGSYKNLVKIINSTNDLQIRDSNKDNDESIVEILILVKTGAVYYVLAIVISLAVAYIAMLIVSKKIKSNKEKETKINRIIVIVSIIIIIMLCLIINVFAFEQSNTSMEVDLQLLYDYYGAAPSNSNDPIGSKYWYSYWGSLHNMEYWASNIWTDLQYFLYGPTGNDDKYLPFDVGDGTIFPIADSLSESENRSALFATIQCIHGANVWSAGGYIRTIESTVDLHGTERRRYTEFYAGQHADAFVTNKEELRFMGYMEWMAKVLEGADEAQPYNNMNVNKHMLRWLIYNKGTYTVMNNVFGVTFATTSAGGAFAGGLIPDNVKQKAGEYANKIASDDFVDHGEKLNTVDMLRYDSTIKGYGPVHIKIPPNNITAVITWKDKNGSKKDATVTKLLNSSGQEVDLNGNNINNKQVYIPKEFFKDVKVENATITFTGSCDLIRARFIGAFSNGSSQSMGVLRGVEHDEKDSVSYDVEVRRYAATLDKNLYTIDKKVVTSFNTSKGLRDKNKKEYADKGDEVVFRYDVANIGVATNLRVIEIKDDIPNGLQIMSIGDSPNGTSSSNWNLSGDVITLKSGKKIEPEQKFTFYIKYKVTREITSNNIELTNKVYFRDVWGDDSEHVYYKNSYTGNPTVNEMDMDESKCKDYDTVYTKTYKYIVAKDIQKITDAKGANVELTTPTKSTEVGDIVTYQIKISTAKQNEGSKVYGDVKFEIKDELPTDFDFVSLKSSGAITVQRQGNTITGEGTLSPENNKTEAEILIEMRVPERLLDIKPKTVSNTSKSDKNKVTNKNNEKIPEGTNSSKFESKIDVIVKGYKWTFEKVIDSVKTSHGKEVKATKAYPEGAIDIVELGDIITYKITVTNIGNNSLEYGALCNVNVKDLFNEGYLRYLPESEQNYGAGWSKTGNYTYQYSERVKTVPDKNIAELYIKMKVIYLNYDKEVKMTNNANITKIDNRNDIDLRSLPNKQEDKVDAYEQVYAMGFKKNIVHRQTNQGGEFPTKKPEKPYVNAGGKGNRIDLTDKEKYDNPIEVEQGDIVTYEIEVNNPAQFRNKSGNNYVQTTNLRQLFITDTLEQGITFINGSTVVKKGGSTITGCIDVTCTNNDIGDNTLIFRYKNDTGSNYLSSNYTISPGEKIVIQYKCEVTRTNMHLQNLKNVAVMTSIQNRNDYDFISQEYDRMLNDEYLQEPPHETYNEDYIRLKNLIISGTVWEAKNEGIEFSTGAEGIKDIVVNLYDNTNNKVASVRTDDNGYYKFDTGHGLEHDNGTYYDKDTEYNPTQNGGNHANKLMIEGTSDNAGDSNVGRVIKGTNRDEVTGNYDETSEHINYYLEFRYNGIKYSSIPRYSGSNNISNKDVTNEINDNYKIDSNAREYTDLRRKFNEDHETIAYKTSINRTSEEGLKTPIIFDKTNNPHESHYQWTEETTMNSYSFTVAENYDRKLRDDGDLGRWGEANPNIDMLFFGRNDNETDRVKTEYLKYINLGLVERAELNLSLKKDVTFAQVRVNEDILDYNYNQVKPEDKYIRAINSGKEGVYGLFIYKSDFYYRYYMYQNTAVRNARGEQSELQIDLNYKITIKNETGGEREEDKTYVKIDEILDYCTDKMKLDKAGVYVLHFNKEGTQIGQKLIGENDIHSNDKDNPDGKINSFQISYSNGVTFNDTSGNNYKIDGYRTSFIRGLDEFILQNGERLELYVRYNIDKNDLPVVAPINEEDGNILKRVLELGEKMNVAQTSAYSTYDENGKPEGLIDTNSNAGNVLSKDDKNNHYDLLSSKIIGDGNQNISVKIGATDRYEDNTFRIRLDIQLKGNNIPPSNPPDVEDPPEKTPPGTPPGIPVEPPWNDPPNDPPWTPPGTPPEDPPGTPPWTPPATPPTTPPSTNTVERSISGFVWEDARSERIVDDGSNVSDPITSTKLNQFVGNGIFTKNSTEQQKRHKELNAWYESKEDFAKVDEYGHKRAEPQDQNHDIAEDKPIAGIKVEMVQLIDVGGITYEEIIDFKTLQAVLEATNTQDFNGFKRFAEGVTLTKDNSNGREGEYQLQGFLPGKYVVRFRYGDKYLDKELTSADLNTLTVGTIEKLTSGSLVHNGQDYKSTTYGTKDTSGNLVENDDNTTNVQKLIALMTSEADGSGKQKIVSDARDNELRRLEIMGNTEKMNGESAYDMNYTNYNKYKNNGNIDKTAQEILESTDPVDDEAKERIREFIEATKCFADTVEIEFYIEDEVNNTRKETPEPNKIVNGIPVDVVKRANYYVEYDTTTEERDGGGFSDLTVTIPNVDFGIEYRPENFVKLEKSIKSIKVETSAGNVLVDIEYDINGTMTKDIGAINMQAINTVKNPITQGFRYINIDEDLMQGSTITIDYYAKVTNIGETDTVGDLLYQAGAEKGKTNGVLKVLNEIEDNNPTEFSIGAKYAFSKLKKLFYYAYGLANYTYGDFLGDIYYKGNTITSMNNVNIAPITVERILEWVDNDATFVADNNKEKNRYWISTTEKALIEKGLINAEGVKWDVEKSKLMPVTSKLLVQEDTEDIELERNGKIKIRKQFYYLDEKGRKYTTETKQNLAINVDTNNENPDLVKAIYPKICNSYSIGESEGTIEIRTNSVLSSGGHEDNDMTYEAVAEIVQIDTVTGRRTNFATSVGNLALANGKTPFLKGTDDPDSSSTEVIKLTPPTGLNKTHLMLAYNMRIIETVVLIIAITLSGTFGFKYLKNRKKFYK